MRNKFLNPMLARALYRQNGTERGVSDVRLGRV